MKTVTYFQIMRNADLNEGRGPLFPIDVGFTNKASALTFVRSEHYAETYGVMGSRGSDDDVKEIEVSIYTSYGEWNEQKKSHQKAIALAKLTEEDRKLLGL